MINSAKWLCGKCFSWRRIRCGAIIIFGLYVVSNIALNSPWMKSMLAEKLQQRTGLEWKIGTATWSPAGGVRLKQIYAPLGDGGVFVERIHVRLTWREVLRPGRGVEEVIIIRPTIDLSVRELANRQQGPMDEEFIPDTHPATGDVAAIKQSDPAVDDADEMQAGFPSGKGGSDEVATSSKPSNTSKSGDERLEHEKKEVWLKMLGGKIILRDGDRVLANVRQIDASALLGGNGVGRVSWSGGDFIGEEILDAGSLKVESKGYVVAVTEGEVVVSGVSLKPRLFLMPNSGRILFQAGIVVPKQSLKIQRSIDGVPLSFVMESIAGGMRVEGDLLVPKSWSGYGECLGSGVALQEGHRGGLAYFDALRAQMVVRNGILWVPAAMANSADLSLMGNGVLMGNGYGYGIMRVVASADKRAWFERVYAGAGIAGASGQQSLMSVLDTMDRFSTDIRVDGSFINPEVQMGEGAQWLSLRRVLDNMHRFMREERSEDQVDGGITKDQQ